MPFFDPIRIGASGAADDYTIDRSLRFNDDDSSYLSRTPSSAGNRKTFTFSAWVKRSSFGRGVLLGASTNVGSQENGIEFDSTIIRCYEYTGSFGYRIETNAKYRDPSAWMHIVFALDTTQASSGNRAKLYVNGEQITDLNANTQPSQNHDSAYLNTTTEQRIGQLAGSHDFDGYMAEINFIDGFQYDPSYFGETDATTGQWNPKKYTGSYGTNGFYLNFSDNSGTSATTLGKDSSGNGNNFTPNNFSVSAGVGNDSLEDTPTNNFCTLNPLAMTATGNVTPSNGNLDASYGSGSGGIAGTFAVSSGKWYWEITVTATSSARIDTGVIDDTFEIYNGSARYNPGIDSKSYAYTSLGTKYNNNTDTSYGATYGTNDVIGIALDLDNGTITFYKNNVSQGQAFSGLTGGFLPGVGDGNSSGTHSISANFGQRAFAYTAPTGYKKLNSANLPDPTILLPNKHFNTLLYTGNGAASGHQITGLNFQPDWVWIKNRTQTFDHMLFDAVRGAGKYLESNTTDTEATGSHQESFDSNGFTVGAGDSSNRTNLNSIPYVAWNWNAGDTDGKTYAVKVVSDSGNKYRFDDFGTSAVTLDLAEGGTYIFDQSDSSNSGHPLRFSTTSDGTHGGGSEYTTGVTTSGTPGSSGAKTTITVAASAPTLYYYCTQHSGMGGQADTNSTLGSSNFDGTLQSTVKVNATAGFSIVSYTVGNFSGMTMGHGLGVSPVIAISKKRSGTSDWSVQFVNPSDNSTDYMFLNKTDAKGDTSTYFTSTTVKDGFGTGANGDTIIQYVFSEVAGYSKFGSYVSNGASSDNTFVFTGFRPAWVMIKASSTGGSTSYSWMILDNTREPFNSMFKRLQPNESASETTNTGTTAYIDFLSNGFKIRGNGSLIGQSGVTYIYLCFAESPFKYARAR